MKKNTIYIFVITAIFYFIFNFPILVRSITIKPIANKINKGIKPNDYELQSFISYARDIAEIRVRGCFVSANVVSLNCNKELSKWVLGDYSETLDKQLRKSEK